ncbi:MAG: hypothetical protein LAT58_04615, partial [Opitutales bacterium]|nr:hypothetical protein [Opitutales bacterium]
LLGQAGGDGAKEEMAELLSARSDEERPLQGTKKLFFNGLARGLVVGSREFVEKCRERWFSRRNNEPVDICEGVSVGKKIYRKGGSWK